MLWLWDNPICSLPNYRQFIVQMLPNLTKLDNANVTAEEKQGLQEIDVNQQQQLASGMARSNSGVRQSAETKKLAQPSSAYQQQTSQE